MTLRTDWTDGTGQQVDAAYLNALDTQVNTNTTDIATNTSAITAKASDSAVVHNTGAETVAGVKTFSASPIVPTPTTSTQAATKGYVDTVGTKINGVTVSGTPSVGQVPTATSSSAATWQTPSGGGGGFSDPTTTKGDLIVHGTTTTRLPVGADGQMLTADSTQTLGVKWAPTPTGTTNNNDVGIINVLDYGADRTGVTASDTAFFNAWQALVSGASNT